MHVVPLEAFDQTIAQPCQVGKHFDKGETFNAGLTNHRHKIWIECRFAANELDLPAAELRRLVEDARPIARARLSEQPVGDCRYPLNDAGSRGRQESSGRLVTTNIVRFKSSWEEDYKTWCQRDLKAKRYVYWWADGVYFNVRLFARAIAIFGN